jgi:hypothetical protein
MKSINTCPASTTLGTARSVPARADVKRYVYAQIIDECLTSSRAPLSALCMTGGLARDEATFRPEGMDEKSGEPTSV